MKLNFTPVSACVGRNLAALELLIIIASILRRFDFVLENPEEPVSDIFALVPLHISLIRA